MKKLASIFFLLISTACLGQVDEKVGDLYIGYKRDYLQTVLRDYSILEYEREYVGFQINDELLLYVFFDKEQLCTKYYWLANADLKDGMVAQLKNKFWQEENEKLYYNTLSKCTIEPFGEGNKLIFLVEYYLKTIAINDTPVPATPPSTRAEIQKKPKEKSVSNEDKKLKKEPSEKPKYQGLKIWGWKVVKF